ncbi:MAG: citrate transporter [Lachnospiraceae bacterium]|nr:citrate transporter [Lachnospiraceae bacterium]
MKPIIAFIKKETVLTVAWILAIVSMFFVPPNEAYVDYIDFRTLGILWSLMVIMEGLNSEGLFETVGSKMIKRTNNVLQLSLTLVFLCFFSSMFITNDVALLTFVPFSIFILEACDKDELLVPVIALQTIAANMGSMLTPIGNPQNIYLFSLSDMSIAEFVMLMLPYSVMTFILLLICVLLLPRKHDAIEMAERHLKGSKKKCSVYAVLFVIALFSVAKILPYYWIVILVLVVCFLMDKQILLKIDYALLFTFIGFFIFTGNLGTLDFIRNGLLKIITGHEMATGVLASQLISNVPAALLLSDFAANLRGLLLGVNLGGLGTLIASMASLISFKLLAHHRNELKGKYFFVFTLLNVIYLLILCSLYGVIGPK